jgi:ribosomal protein S18 acetylase RimI-like enzyme
VSAVVAREVRGSDFAAARARADEWMGRPVGLVMHRLFFEQLGPHGVWLSRGDEPVGFLLGLLSAAEPDLAYVHFHIVDPARRGEGLGTRLYEEFGVRAAARGATRIRALAPLWNTPSIAFHERLGFAGEVYPDYVGPGEDRRVFERALPFSRR